MACNHEITINDICVKCGIHVIITKGRPCSECISFINNSTNRVSCKKELMRGTMDSFESHKISELDCFEKHDG